MGEERTGGSRNNSLIRIHSLKSTKVEEGGTARERLAGRNIMKEEALGPSG